MRRYSTGSRNPVLMNGCMKNTAITLSWEAESDQDLQSVAIMASLIRYEPSCRRTFFRGLLRMECLTMN